MLVTAESPSIGMDNRRTNNYCAEPLHCPKLLTHVLYSAQLFFTTVSWAMPARPSV